MPRWRAGLNRHDSMRHCLYVSEAPDSALLRALGESYSQCDVARKFEAAWALQGQPYTLAVIDAGPEDTALVGQCSMARDAATLLVVVARDDDKDLRIASLRAGADACLSRPLSIRELEAVVEALARRAAPGRFRQRGTLPSGRGNGGNPGAASATLTVIRNGRQVFQGTREIRLTASEWALLCMLGTHPGATVSRAAIQNGLGSGRKDVDHDSVDGAVFRLRKKLAGASVRIASQRGVGYRLEGSVEFR